MLLALVTPLALPLSVEYRVCKLAGKAVVTTATVRIVLEQQIFLLQASSRPSAKKKQCLAKIGKPAFAMEQGPYPKGSISPHDLRRWNEESAARSRTEATDGHFSLFPFMSAVTATSCSRWQKTLSKSDTDEVWDILQGCLGWIQWHAQLSLSPRTLKDTTSRLIQAHHMLKVFLPWHVLRWMHATWLFKWSKASPWSC